MVDRYTKAVLTVIAMALTVIAGQHALSPAQAQFGPQAARGCGSERNPCAVINVIYERSAGEFRACSEVGLPCYGVKLANPPR